MLKHKSMKLALTSAGLLLLVSPAANAQNFTTDVIIQSSACVGVDCVIGEVFGFDTLRLDENNLRMHFDDTSATGSFPGNDWRIIINDSTNGGANYFAVEDATAGLVPFRVEAGAPANALTVATTGNVGIGTLTPVVETHIVDGDSPAIRLEQDGSSGFTPQVYDIAANETNFFIRDVTNGSNLFFRAQTGAPEDALYIANDGQIGIGNASPQAALHIEAQGGRANILLDGGTSSSPTGSSWDFTVRNSDGEFAINDMSTTGGDFIFRTADNGANTPWEFVHRGDDGFGINTNSSTGGDFILSNSGDLRILGTITSGGPTCSSGCDAVFNEDYDLPSIEDHAEAMFADRHLPAVGPTSPDEDINLTEHMGNVLNELEKAHIYIAQLNEQNKDLQARLEKLEAAQK